jgi:predicted Zn-dependent peptidase
MLFLVVNRPTAPQVACRLAIRAGSAFEATGKTGIAHLLEHMMFKGTKNFGTVDYKKDQELQEQIETAYQHIRKEQQKRRPDPELIRAKRAEMERLRLEVQKIYVAQAFSSQLSKNGAVGINAFTSQDQTQYIASVPSDMLEQWFSIISEQLFEPSWREFFVEKEVVQREWAFRYINSPSGAAWLDLYAAAYSAHPYRNPVIGWKSDMEKYSTRDAIEFHSRFYNPANAVCVLVGDVTLADARQLAETYFARYPAGERSPEMVTREPPQQGERRSVRYLKGARTPLIRIGFHGAPMGSDDFFALDALTMVLSHGRGARLPQRIVNQGLAVEAWAYNPDNRFGGMVILGGSPAEPDAGGPSAAENDDRRARYLKACEELEALLLGQVEQLKSKPVSHRELERIKKINQRDFLDRMRSNEDLAGTLATLEVQTGWRYLNEYLARIAAVSAEDIQRVAQRYLREENKTSVYVIPGGTPDQPPASYSEERIVSSSAADRATVSTDRRNHSDFPTPAGWKHPLSFYREPNRITYPEAERLTIGGADVFFIQDAEVPLIDAAFFVKAGAVDLDETEAGLPGLLNAALIRGGTERYSPSELATVLDENGIRIEFNVAEEDTAIRLSVIRDDWEKGIDLLAELLTRPRLDPKVLEAARTQMLMMLDRQAGDAQTVAFRESMIKRFPGHPYGRDPLAARDTLPRLSADDLKNFITSRVVPANLKVAVSGDIDSPRVVRGLERLFDQLPQSPPPPRRLAAPRKAPAQMTLIHKPGQVQSQVVLTLPGPRRTHPDYWESSLLMSVFGGSDSLMYKRLRDDLGLVYSAGFYQTYKWQTGLLVGYIGCKGDKTADAVSETMKIMSALRQEVPAAEFSRKRLDALNSFVFNVDTKSDLVEVYGRYALRDEPLDTLDLIQDAFFDATKADLQRIAGERLVPADIQITIVGDKQVPVRQADGTERSLGLALQDLALELGIPFEELPLR